MLCDNTNSLRTAYTVGVGIGMCRNVAGKCSRALDVWWLLGELPCGLYRGARPGPNHHTVVLLW